MAEKSPNPDWLKYGEMITCLFIQNIITMKERDKFLDRLDKKFDSLARGCGEQDKKVPLNAELVKAQQPTPTSSKNHSDEYGFDKSSKLRKGGSNPPLSQSSEIVEWAKTIKFYKLKNGTKVAKELLTLILKIFELNENDIGEGQFKEGFKFAQVSLELKKDEIRKALEVLGK